MNSNGYVNLSFPAFLIENVARLIDAITLQFPYVGDVLSPYLEVKSIIVGLYDIPYLNVSIFYETFWPSL